MRTPPLNVQDFLSSRCIAVIGASGTKENVGTLVMKKLMSAGMKVVPINPHSTSVMGVPCYPQLSSAPLEIDAVFVATRASRSEQFVRDAHERGITKMWFHKGIGAGSASPESLQLCKDYGITVISDSCPMWYVGPVDVFHKCLRFLH